MNLLTAPWMPVRTRDGRREWVDPSRLSSPDILAFDADRADFNGALAQFAIGLLQTTTPIQGPAQWRALFKELPSASTLEDWFAAARPAFEFDGDGARFMQDFSLTAADGSAADIAALLIETPGKSTQEDNADHFVKRGRVHRLCPRCAATALFTLQVNAPEGGSGIRTGLRGGGPLTTLLQASKGAALWQHLWLNVIEQERFLTDDVSALNALQLSFPWMADISVLQKEDGEIAPVHTHPAHVFWAMPRRIRLDFASTCNGTCDICGQVTDGLLRKYFARKHGLNYKGPWNHPLSPHYEADGAWQPLHPRPGGLGYRHWLAWVLGQTSERKKQRCARVVEHFLTHRTRTAPGALRVWAFGYDMKQMKARCWYESSLPLYGLGDCGPRAQREVESQVSCWLQGAELAASYLRGAVKDAWFSADAKGDFSVVDAAFWSHTEAPFYRQLQGLINSVRNEQRVDTVAVNTAWLRCLSDAAHRLFDTEFAGTGLIERQDARRVAEAHHSMQRNLRGPKLRQALGLPTEAPAKRPANEKPPQHPRGNRP